MIHICTHMYVKDPTFVSQYYGKTSHKAKETLPAKPHKGDLKAEVGDGNKMSSSE